MLITKFSGVHSEVCINLMEFKFDFNLIKFLLVHSSDNCR